MTKSEKDQFENGIIFGAAIAFDAMDQDPASARVLREKVRAFIRSECSLEELRATFDIVSSATQDARIRAHFS